MKPWTALAAGIALTGLGTVAALAEEQPVQRKQIRKIVITHADGSEKTVDVEDLRGRAHCAGGSHRFEHSDETTSGDKTKINRVVICGKDDEDRLAALERARARLAEQKDWGIDPREKALAALDAEIARLKAGRDAR